MKVKSSMTNRMIDFDDNIIIINPKQAAFYWNKGIQPVHIYPSTDTNTGEPIVVFVFQRSATYEAYKEWIERR